MCHVVLFRVLVSAGCPGVLATAGRQLQRRDPWYDFRVCAEEPGKTRTSAGFVAMTPHGVDALAEADTVIVAPCGSPDARPPCVLVDAVREA